MILLNYINLDYLNQAAYAIAYNYSREEQKTIIDSLNLNVIQHIYLTSRILTLIKLKSKQ